MGAAYISVDVSTVTSNLRPGCLGPRVFAIIREIAAAVLPALPLAYAICSLKKSRWSNMTPKSFRLGRDLVVAYPILIVAVSIFFLLLIRTASVLWAAKASPLKSSHALARFPASLQILYASGSFFDVTSLAMSSARPMSGASSGIVFPRIPSCVTQKCLLWLGTNIGDPDVIPYQQRITL